MYTHEWDWICQKFKHIGHTHTHILRKHFFCRISFYFASFYSFANVGFASRAKFICLSQMRVWLFKKEIINCDWIDLNLLALLDRLILIFHIYFIFGYCYCVCLSGCVCLCACDELMLYVFNFADGVFLRNALKAEWKWLVNMKQPT